MLKREEILHKEKLSLLLYMKYRNFLSITESAGKVKNTSESEASRNLGNQLYRRRPHDSSTHEDIFHYYSQSIALAPNSSEDLALGYSNRSALFFHIKKYKECLTDVDRALSITCSNLLKVKLLCRKAESLKMLNQSTKSVCKEAFQILEQLKESDKSVYSEKLNQLLVTKNRPIKFNNIKLPKKDSSFNKLLNFECSEQIPSVSKSVAIKYDKKWGRHVVATKDIKPGEIISVQESCFTHIGYEKMYLYCSYCKIIAYNSLPCEFCIYSIYCSETCQSKAWIEYHQYECVVYQHSIMLNDGILYMRFVLSAIYQVGSIEQMKEHILEIENTADPQIKGFSNGIFYTEQKKNLYTFKQCSEENDLQYNTKKTLIANICNCVYLLAKFTNFFGQNTNVQEPELLLDEDRLFIAALILRTGYIITINFEILSLKCSKPYLTDYHVDLFSNMINHNCHSNVRSVRTNNGKNIMFACHPIKKGSQLFKVYNRMDISQPKKIRQPLLETWKITCECIACTEDWSPISVPSIEQLFEITPSLDASVVKTNRILLKEADPEHGFSRFTPKLLNQVCHHLAELAEKFTVVSKEYFMFLQFIEDLIYEVFSENLFEMPAQCE